MKVHAEEVSSPCAVGAVFPTLVATSVDRIDRSFGTTEQMERVGASLLNATVSENGEDPGRGEGLLILLLHFFEPRSPKTQEIFYCLRLCKTVARGESRPL
jgi:hypothetical protein